MKRKSVRARSREPKSFRKYRLPKPSDENYDDRHHQRHTRDAKQPHLPTAILTDHAGPPGCARHQQKANVSQQTDRARLVIGFLLLATDTRKHGVLTYQPRAGLRVNPESCGYKTIKFQFHHTLIVAPQSFA